MYMSNRQNHCNPNSVWLRLSLAEGCARPSLPLGDEPNFLRHFEL